MEFRVTGLGELERDLKKAVNQCPEVAKDTLKTLGNDFKKAAKNKANRDLKSHTRTGNQKKKAIKAKWGSKVVGDRLGMAALIWNSARHFHLVDKGHNLVKDGRVIGFVPGKHIMQKTKQEFEEIVPEVFEKMIDNILRGNQL